MAELVSKRYAISLFDAGLELEKIETFYKELEFLDSILESEDRLFKLLKNPRITKVEKKSLITEIFKGKLSLEVLNFLYIIIDKSRERFILEIIKEYKSIFNEHKNILNVEAVTAVPMDNKSIEKLKLVLQNKLNKSIQISNRIDKSIIGGVLLKMNEKIIDSTLASQLKNMEATINKVSL